MARAFFIQFSLGVGLLLGASAPLYAEAPAAQAFQEAAPALPDCKNPQNLSQLRRCANPELLGLQERVSRAYLKLHQALPKAGRPALERNQQFWQTLMNADFNSRDYYSEANNLALMAEQDRLLYQSREKLLSHYLQYPNDILKGLKGAEAKSFLPAMLLWSELGNKLYADCEKDSLTPQNLKKGLQARIACYRRFAQGVLEAAVSPEERQAYWKKYDGALQGVLALNPEGESVSPMRLSREVRFSRMEAMSVLCLYAVRRPMDTDYECFN